MKFNTDSSFVGLERIKQAQAGQLVEFEAWAAQNLWNCFHLNHYDWWAFPINRRSAYGLAWTVYEGEIDALKQDPRFLQSYLRGVQLVAASWGWDLDRAAPIPDPRPGQSWHHWPVRLFKAALSLQLFGYTEYFDSLKIYALDLIRQGEPMEYHRRDLSWLFTGGVDPSPGR